MTRNSRVIGGSQSSVRQQKRLDLSRVSDSDKAGEKVSVKIPTNHTRGAYHKAMEERWRTYLRKEEKQPSFTDHLTKGAGCRPKYETTIVSIDCSSFKCREL